MTGHADARGGRRRRVAAGHIVLWAGGSLWIGHVEEAVGAHAHHALQVTLALDGPARLRGRGDAQWRAYRGAVVGSRCPHELDARGQTVALLFVEPESPAGRALADRYPARSVHSLAPSMIDPIVAQLAEAYAGGQKAQLLAAGRAAVATLTAGAVPRRALDPRVARAIAWLRGALDGPVTLAGTAAAVALSPGRFRHLFVAETGLTFRAYVLWLRLSRAVELVAARRPVTEAAHAAGFADAAHLSRTFRRTFGVAPAMLDPR
jgi:AraC-like DNA-binding protein